MIEPLLPPPASVPLSSALYTTIVKIRRICEQIGAALEKHVAPAPRRPAGRLLPSASVGALGQGQRMPAPAPRARGAGGRYFYALDTLQNPSGHAAAFKEVPEMKPLKAVRSLPMF